MNDEIHSAQGDAEKKRKTSSLRGLIYFIIACILIAVPFVVYRVFILGPLQQLMGK